VKGPRHVCRDVLTHALTEENFFEALIRIGILYRVKKGVTSWNIQSERCSNMIRKAVDSYHSSMILESVLDLLSRFTRMGRRSPDLLTDSEFETRNMSLNTRVTKRLRLMQLAANVRVHR